MPTVAVQVEGLYVGEGGPEAYVGGATGVLRIDEETGMATLRIPASKLEVRQQYSVFESVPMNDPDIVRLAVKYAGMPLSHVESMNPALAAQLQNEGIVEGDEP